MNISNTRNKLAVYLLIISGVFLFLYTTTRAYLMSITWDESLSYLEYIRNNIILWESYDFMSANNHLLNTLSGIVFTKLFGVSEFSLRIGSLIAHAFFLFYSAKLVLHFENKWIALSAFLILNLNPFLLDFFSLARGYSFSIAFMMASVYYLYLMHIKNYRTKYALISLLFSALATFGNLTLLNYSVVLFGLIVLLIGYNNFKKESSIAKVLKQSLIQLFLPLVFMGLFLWFVLPYSFALRNAGALFMGGEVGLWHDTVGELVGPLLYEFEHDTFFQQFTKYTFVVILLLATAFVGMNHARKNITDQNMFLGSLLLLLILILSFSVFQHYFLGTLYLIQRAALFLFVLLMLIFVFLINELYSKRKIVQSIIHVFALVVSIHFLSSFNLKYVYEWKDECETKEMLADLKKIKQVPEGKFNTTMSMPLILESAINYYRVTDTLTWLNQAIREKKVNYLNDYFFLKKDQYDTINQDSLVVIKQYPVTGNILAKQKYKWNKSTVLLDTVIDLESTSIDCTMKPDQEYSPSFTYRITDVNASENSLASIKYTVTVKEKSDANLYMILIIQNNKGETVVWLRPNLMDFIYNEGQRTEAFYTYNFPSQLKPGDELKAFLWNPNKKELLLNKMEMKVIKYE